MLETLLIATVGGVLIGLAAGLLLAANRRNAGISDIAAGLLWCRRDDIAWRLAFLLGLAGRFALGIYGFCRGAVAVQR